MSPEAQACWTHFKSTEIAADDSRLYEVFSFGDSEALADELGALVVNGRKRATAGSLWILEAAGRQPPRPGDFSIVTTSAGQPLCVIETVSVDIVPFGDVGADFAAAEGEGDESLAFWRAAHTAYFERECARIGRAFSADMPVVCERFEVASLWPAGTPPRGPVDPLDRFVQAQQADYERALAELVAGRKQTHWVWYVLPQLRDLGRSNLAREYGIADRSEAAAYLAHPLLGPRLLECVGALLGHKDKRAAEILGDVDAMKFRSCLTLFAAVAPEEPAFRAALAAFYQGQPDPVTLRLLGSLEG